ncbi:hypothetical protein EFN20_08015 [Propionibacterium freudenreichii]|uniref:Uncharacterized protein n=1 Tax=Propionibacterium freudenreichii subsp. shermanii (strain ATCC 9614 / DSM 4902 / CIP 103027 / NCIMB 8099 / CIRM-BIA1) TaxID=754252 RepID=D7GG86_PROFC|nr:hypothetical protein [Propionibacterium freudenreichii]PWM98436.1 MAG: hypothetical protein DBX96_05345 [Propionibacterium sp.]MCQ1998074.1 hypothetical protein [Propionibacterium freudenreichii]MCT2975514.1 hypothetical protein [Propionibacterium freudenreichii]MCT3005022.1 hypothetical protein [Propionibacterium freudenreichii]MCT3009798.1 hypothetical protein [Propionibacterium freudenreichii]
MSKKRATWYFQLPWHVESPLLTDIGLALDRVVPRDPEHLPPATVTLMDTADERLQRAGVKVAQQSYGDHGEWFVWGPDWTPWLPAERDDPVGVEAELPDEVADLTRPFRGRNALRPVVVATRMRVRYAVIDDHGTVVATLTSDRIVVRRRGVAAGRFRQVAIDVAGLDPQRRAFIIERFEAIGAQRVDALPHLFEQAVAASRDDALPGERPAGGSLDAFVGWVLARRAREVITNDLALRSGEVGDATALVVALAGLRDELEALSGLLQPAWRDEQLRRLDALGPDPDGHVLAHDDYLDLLDALEAATRTPPLTVDGATAARAVLGERLGGDRLRLIGHVDALIRGDLVGGDLMGRDQARGGGSQSITRKEWMRALTVGEQALQLTEVAGVLFGRRKHMVRLLGKVVAALSAARPPEGPLSDDGIAELSPAQAYAAGRAVERGLQVTGAERRYLVDHWPTWRAKLLALTFSSNKPSASGDHR